MKKPDGILFDLDDTILAFSDASEKAWKRCCDNFVASNEVSCSNEELLHTVSKVREWYWSDEDRNKKGRMNIKNARREVFELAVKHYEYKNQAAIYDTADTYTRLQEEMWALFDGVPESLKLLKDEGIKLAVVTNGKSEYQRRKLTRFHLEQYFDEIIIDSEVGFSKPEIGIYQVALSRLGIEAEKTFMVGDNLEWDVHAPQKIGIFGIWNDFNQKGLPENSTVVPDCIVDSIQTMTRLII